MSKKMVDLLAEAQREILVLRHHNEILTVRAEELQVVVLQIKAANRSRRDVVQDLQKQIDLINTPQVAEEAKEES